MQINDLLAIMTESDGVKILQDFTGDRNQLLQTLDLLRMLDQVKADPGPDTGAAVDVDRQLISLHTAVQMLASLNGKKTVIYFTEPLDQRTESAEFRPLLDAAIRANVAFYTVDARGLMQDPPAEAKQQQEEELTRKLRELAKRQQELAAQQKNGQQATADQSWQQEMLRREFRQLQLEIFQLNRSEILSRSGLQDQPPAADESHVISAEDMLQIRVAQPEGVTGTYAVRPDGTMSMPFIRDVKAAGLTTAQLEAVIADRLEAYASHPTVTVFVVTIHKRQ
jgi:hypothetical protein